MRRSAIVVTTIFEPVFLEGYVRNLREFDRIADTEIIVIPDRKTPASVAAECARARAGGARVSCPSLAEQETFLSRFPSLAGRIPYDSDNRRNVGYLMALDGGADVLISIDDDNHCVDGVDFVGGHEAAGTATSAPEVSGSDGWLNFCAYLSGSPAIEIFPRGFPYAARRTARTVAVTPAVDRATAINVGLWTGDPDVDAVSRLALAPIVERADAGSRFLAPDTWSPINTQNTAMSRDAVAAYYYVRMGARVGGMAIDRYGDIFSGYFLQRCVRARGEAIRFGAPVARHIRTPHNLFRDLAQEVAGMVILEDLLPWLKEVRLPDSSYPEAYAGLADELESASPRFRGFLWDQGAGEFLRETAGHMRAWLAAVGEIGL